MLSCLLRSYFRCTSNSVACKTSLIHIWQLILGRMCKYRWLKRGQWDLSFKKGTRLGLDRGRTPWPDRGCSLAVLRLRLEPLQLPEWVQILSHNCRFAFCAASGPVDFSQALLRYLFTSCGSELHNIDYPSFWRLKWGFLRLQFDSCIVAFLWCHGAQLWVPSEWLIGFLILLLLVHWTPSEHDSHDWDFIRDSVASFAVSRNGKGWIIWCIE